MKRAKLKLSRHTVCLLSSSQLRDLHAGSAACPATVQPVPRTVMACRATDCMCRI